MIIPFKTSEHGQDEYIICLRSPMTVAELRERMLQRAKVSQGSYAYQLIDNLHAQIFIRSLDLKADYAIYFAREYASFFDYLRRRERLPLEIVARLAEAFDMSIGMYYYKLGYAFLTDTYGLEFLTRLVEDMPQGELS
ncbi:hypothetical protein [Candidatus Oscillochloris fontis]|uniref:hypothetical protein n=1 Tax=Candidatus Oscillochloris fontis TaxID=2496868 RepID=UPI00101CCD27|nr:hypothetical protein [Candidatus Oscillochloris fontis]